MAKLYPPMIESTLPAFYGNTITVPFVMNRAVGKNDITGMYLLVKHIVSGTEVLHADATYYTEHSATFNVDSNKLKIGQFYKIQLAYKQGSEIGYLSTVGVAKCAAAPGNNNPTLTCDTEGMCTGTYVVPSNDSQEKVYSYCFDLYDNAGQLRASSGEQLHNTDADVGNQQTDFWRIPIGRKPGDHLSYVIKTMNNMEVGRVITGEALHIPPTEDRLIDFDLQALLKAKMDNERGAVEVSIDTRSLNVYTGAGIESNTISGSFILSRKTNQDNIWQEIKRFSLNNVSLPIHLWTDYTLEAGVEYTYALQFFNSHGAYSTHILNAEGPQVADFEDAFLYDGEKQLCIKYNPKVSSFKTVKLESKVNTIGGKYPFIFRNGDTEYKEFQISGLLSALSDPEGDFCEPAAAGEPRNRTGSHATIGETSATNLTADNFRRERNFKLAILNWLNNGKPKLFRSPGEGNYIVRIMNTSLTPIDTLGRMIHNFNCQATEVADYTWNNLLDLQYTALNKELSLGPVEEDPFDGIPLLDAYYEEPSTLEIGSFNSQINLATINITENLSLADCNITNVTIENLPVYTIKYRYEQVSVIVTDVFGRNQIYWSIRQVKPRTESELSGLEAYNAGLPGIYYFYGKTTDSELAGRLWEDKLPYEIFKAQVAAADSTVIQYSKDNRLEEVSGILPLNRIYQINMRKYDSNQVRSVDLIEDVYAIHLGVGQKAIITYEPPVGGL